MRNDENEKKVYPVVLTIDEAAKCMSLSRNTLLYLVRSKQLPAFKYGRGGQGRGKWLVSKEGIQDYVHRQIAAAA